MSFSLRLISFSLNISSDNLARRSNSLSSALPALKLVEIAAALSTNLHAGTADDKEFERRARLSELMFKEKEIDLKEKDMLQKLDIVKMQMNTPLTD